MIYFVHFDASGRPDDTASAETLAPPARLAALGFTQVGYDVWEAARVALDAQTQARMDREANVVYPKVTG